MKIVVNTISTKKNAGGAFQIALNFLLKTLEYKAIDWYYFVSNDLDSVVGKYVVDKSKYYVFPTQPDFFGTYNSVKKKLKIIEDLIKPDLIYSITAPSYFYFKAPEVMRFTNPWITHPNEYAWRVLSFKEKIRYKIYSIIQIELMKRAKYFVTQTETAKSGIIRVTKTLPDNVCVVSNVLPAVYKNVNRTHIDNSSWIDIACIAAPVPHKNLDIIPEVIEVLKSKGYTNVRFHVTIPEESNVYKKIYRRILEIDSSDNFINHGRCSQIQLVDIYRICEIAFLPTLLEVFSASTIEAMFFDLKIIATDFDFNKDVLGDACLYYEPMNAIDASEKIIQIIDNNDLQHDLSDKMKKCLSKYVDYDNHFNSIVNFLINVVKGK